MGRSSFVWNECGWVGMEEGGLAAVTVRVDGNFMLRSIGKLIAPPLHTDA